MDLIRIFHWASSSPLSSFVHHAVCSKRFKIRCSRKTVCTNVSKTFLPFLSFVLSFFLSFFCCCCCSCCCNCCCCCYQTFNKEPITTLDVTHYKEFITIFTSLYQRMKKLSYTLSCIKQNVYTFLFYFLRLSCSYSSHSLHHPSLGLSNSSLTLR